MSITLPKEMAQIVRKKVAAGEYASESEVIRDGLRTLIARDCAMEKWLRQEVASACDALQDNPQSGRSTGEIRATLTAEHARATKRG